MGNLKSINKQNQKQVQTNMEFILIYITHENIEQARKVAEHLLEKRLIACVNYFPIESSYWWKGKIENSKEIVSLCKTKAENWERVREEVEKIHPYETPCIIKLEVESNGSYTDWINKETE